MRKTALVIMAAGIGSRYGGGIKQLAPVDDYGHIIMDYSIHDAIEAGFNKIIFIIRRDIEEDFREIIGNRIEEICSSCGVEVAYCFQDPMDIPGSFPEGRTKPWGTCQAVLAARDIIDCPFAVINADDYYGKSAYRVLRDWLIEDHEDTALSMVGFILGRTLSDNGTVTRGICVIDEGHSHVTDVVETHNIARTADGGAEADGVPLDPNSYVSMNMWGFPAREGELPPFMKVLEDNFITFFRDEVSANPLKAEYLLPVLIGSLLRNGSHTVRVLTSPDRWFGITYAEDIYSVRESFGKLIADGIYEKDLFADL